MKNNKLSPLDELRLEKEIARRECEESEHQLAEQWSYLSDNAVSLIFNSAVNGIASKLGFSARIGNSDHTEKEEKSSNNIFSNILSGVTTYLPFIWEILQPVILGFAAKKIKSIFTKKKK